MAVTHLSRGEVMTLLYDKLQLIKSEAEECEGEQEQGIRLAAQMKARLKRIAVEAKRAASLIETHESIWKTGHCLHCGNTYEEHLDERPPLGTGELARAKAPWNGPRCVALKKLFESAEIETYQGVRIDEVS